MRIAERHSGAACRPPFLVSLYRALGAVPGRALILPFLLITLVIQEPAKAQEAGAFEVRDFLGRTWRNESVRFPLTAEQLKSVRAGRALLGPDMKAATYQLVPGVAASAPLIEVLTDLQPYEARSYRFAASTAPQTTDITVDDKSKLIVLANSRIAISIRKQLERGEGPIAGIRLPSGNFAGDSLVRTDGGFKSYSAKVVARGPVFSEVVCLVEFANGGQWQMRLRVQAFDPVILVDESFSSGDTSAFVFVLNRRYAPTHLFYRQGKGTVGRLATWEFKSEGAAPLFILEPWLHWWERERQGTWFAVYNETETDLLTIGAREAADWIAANATAAARKSTKLALTLEEGGLHLTLPLRSGSRKWMIAALDRDSSLQPLRDGTVQVAPLPQQYFIKHGAFPLNKIKDYVLTWAGDEIDHPRLIITQHDVSRLRARPPAPQPARIPSGKITMHAMDAPIAHYLRTGDPKLGERLSRTAVEWIERLVDMYLRQGSSVTLGFAPHHQSLLLAAINMADVIWSADHLAPAVRERLKAQVAFLAYTVNRPDYWSPERGFSGNPNMTSMVASFQTMLGAMVPAHPMSRRWVDNGLRELKRQLDQWSDQDGGWLEAPHYAVVSYDYMLGAFIAAHNAGFAEHLYDPKMKKVIEWLAKISTPPDAASEGNRHLPPIGNTYMRAPSGLFGVIANLWRERDSVFAAEMQWMHRQHGGPLTPGIGGFFPALAGYRTVLIDAAAPEKAPLYASELFQRTGVILRSHFRTNRETQLHLIAGSNHAHYDRDSGSFTLWGKGRVVANDFGYYGQAPGEDHNMVTSSGAPDGATMQIARFLPGVDVDYVQGTKGAWERKIVFAKDADPAGSNYVVLADSIKGAPGIWRTWFTAQGVILEPRGRALVVGLEDVDTDVHIGLPDVAAGIEARTRETPGMTAGKYGRVSTTQKGLILTIPTDSTLLTVLYPRLKSQKRAIFTTLADGKGVKIETPAGTDYIFAANTRFTHREDAILFEGTLGAVLSRGGQPVLWLGESGSVAAFGKSLKADAAGGRRHDGRTEDALTEPGNALLLETRE